MLPGQYLIQSYLIEAYTYGNYNDNWQCKSATHLQTFNPSLQFEFGLLDWLDITCIGNVLYNDGNNQSDVHLGPTQVWLGMQLLRAPPETSKLNLRFLLFEQFPTGPYQNLSANKSFVGSGSNGSYQSGLSIVLQKTFTTLRKLDLNINFNANYTFYLSPVHVRGYNYYGGNETTDGVIHLGNTFLVDLSAQFSCTQRWAIVSDFSYQYAGKTRFAGNAGDGLSSLAGPSSESFVITPGFEYNLNANIGILATSWLTIAGRNTAAFAGGAISINATF